MEGSWLLYLSTCLALQAVLWWSLGRSQEPGFISIDCGSDATTVYTDENGIQWVGDSDLITEGTPTVVDATYTHVLSTMRVFNGNRSKYCYNLTDSAIKEGAAYMVRATFWAGIAPPYFPRNPDGTFRFKLIVDADSWTDVTIAYGADAEWEDSHIYTRAQRNSIDVCFARSNPGGDAPFVSTLEVRPLPSTLLATAELLSTSSILVAPLMSNGHSNYGVLSSSTAPIIRYPFDPLDRLWKSFYVESDSASNAMETTSAISTEQQQDMLPAKILQDTFTAESISITYSNLVPDSRYYAELFFAEIDPTVNASGQREFNILVNGELKTPLRPIDVYDEVGAYAAYGYGFEAVSNATGYMIFYITPTLTSIYPPYVAAGQFFYAQISNPITDFDTVSAVNDIKASLNLTSYQGDPCFPVGYNYEWLNCTQDPNVTSISLSNYSTGGVIPAALNSLTSLALIYLDGNGLQGEIPDLSALTNLQTLVLSNNELTGSIPEYLGTLTHLKVLDLRNNKLTGEIPANLLERKQASTLVFEFSGNPVCDSNIGVRCTTSPSPADTPLPSTPKKKRNFMIIIGVAVAVILLVGIGIAIAVYCLCRRRSSSTLKQPINGLQNSPMQELPKVYDSPGSGIGKAVPKGSVKEFSFQEIMVITNNFSTYLDMGKSGPVYKGRLDDGRFVAVKLESNSLRQGSKEFLNEVNLLSRVHHKNLVELLGYCTEEKSVLVYRFMSNGSLFDCLHGPHAKASPLPWAMRLRIMVDAAQGLDYLHYGCDPRIIHRDVKSSNILLNDQLEAKISDFGISRNSFANETGAPHTTLMGSMGYMDPEYLSSMKLTEKVDVYSFGVLLFEVVCGKKTVFIDSSHQQTHIVEWARSSIECGVIDDIIDPSLHGKYDISSVWKVLETALTCVSSPSAQRPTMSAVFFELKEAERIELESDQRNVVDKPSAEFTGGSNYNAFSFTRVSAR